MCADADGRIINPLIVTGETPGALAQGIGAALLEQIVCDADGQLLTASMGDYLLPSAPDVPELEMVHRKQWDGRPHPITTSMCQSGSVINHLNRKGRHHADYDNWHRPGQERISGTRGERAWEDGAA
ncbi:MULTISPECIES: molybdopterin cofactor-binding domain-containing protein [unclassified Paraburkholderia]|uniref:molybdopterin cofactor-binding domain-containing protein n=1 Tax=Paraburkholderia TaxID=1822464 RepID=UPI000D328492|nr:MULTISPECIES: molybdopterin cofactor-binding domain-containing protein [unclassified Paraburkholderia]